MGIKKGKNFAHPDLPCLDRHYNPVNSSLCKKRKQDIIANCGDETNLLIELLAVMAENEAAHDICGKPKPNRVENHRLWLISTI